MSWKDIFPKENRYFETENGILYCGNCLEILSEFPNESVDLIVTDPPYGVNYKGGRGKTKGEVLTNDDIDFLDFKEFLQNSFFFMNKVLKSGCSTYIFHDDSKIKPFLLFLQEFSKYWHHANEIIWYKNTIGLGYNDYRYAHECISYGWKGDSHKFYGNASNKDVVFFSSPSNSIRLHPTQKPVKLIDLLVQNSSNKNDIVLDPFLGSGTTAVSCEMLNRRWIGIEIEEKYCKITKERLRDIGRINDIRDYF